jgi:CRISPR/Cas system-associated exonuclease Cas4 (RecB family)
MIPLLIVVTLLLLLAGVYLWWQGRRAQRAGGLPLGEVVYADTAAWEAVPAPLRSWRYGLVGKPDYLVRVQTQGQTMLVPVEVKSRRKPPTPADYHILQLATYCLLVEDVHHVRPAYGLLHYADATLQIPYTDELRRAVLAAAEAIRRGRRADDVARSHDAAWRCRGCGYAHACGEVVQGPNT